MYPESETSYIKAPKWEKFLTEFCHTMKEIRGVPETMIEKYLGNGQYLKYRQKKR
jgi:hypothetical protein